MFIGLQGYPTFVILELYYKEILEQNPKIKARTVSQITKDTTCSPACTSLGYILQLCKFQSINVASSL